MAGEQRVPRFFSLKYGGNYLSYAEASGSVPRRLQFTSNEVLNPLSRFEAVVTSTSEENLVHIKCCYNNKFLVRNSAIGDWIVAGADEPEEDQSKWSCTLMVPTYVASFGAFTFRLPEAQGRFLYSSRSSTDPNYLCVSTYSDPFSATDLSSLVVLPRFVVFRGDNDRYLRTKTIQNQEYLEFDHAHEDDSFFDREVRYETFPTPEGYYRISSFNSGRFWRRDTPNQNDWVWADSTDTTTNNRNTIFKPIKLPNHDEKNIIALECLGNNRYGVRVPSLDGKWDCLNARESAVLRECRIQVEEAVRARSIFDVDYRLAYSKVYAFSDLKTMTTYVTNSDPVNSMTVNVSFKYTERNTSRWTSSHSWLVGVSTTIKTGIPVLVGGEVSIGTTYEGSYVWSEETERTEERTTSTNPTVDAGTSLMVKLVVASVAMDIPFSYTRRDTLMDGTTQESRLHDGVYKALATNFYWTNQPVSAN